MFKLFILAMLLTLFSCAIKKDPENTEVSPVFDKTLKLVKKLEIDDGVVRRPLITVTEDRVYIIYGKMNEWTWDFKVKIFDKNLENELISKTIINGEDSQYGIPMDVRIAVHDEYLYLFYNMVMGSVAYLSGSKFRLNDDFEEVLSMSAPLAEAVLWTDAEVGDEEINDPIVVATESKVHVITRYKGDISKSAETIYKVYELNQELTKIREFDLDLSTVADGGARQASVRYYKGNFYMASSTISTEDITGAQAVVDITSPTDIVIVKFDKNWNILESNTISSGIEDDAESYLSAFDIDDDYFYLSYKHAVFSNEDFVFDTPLKVYDRCYNLVDSVENSGNGRPHLVKADDLIYFGLSLQGLSDDQPQEPIKIYIYELER